MFVPTDNTVFQNIRNKFVAKLPMDFIAQVKELLRQLTDEQQFDDSGYPEFAIDYYGHHKIIDFSLFDQYRGFVHSIIVTIAWGLFLWSLPHKVMGIMRGVPGAWRSMTENRPS